MFYLYLLFHPKLWNLNYKYSETWDRILNNLMDLGVTPERTSLYKVSLSNIDVWISDYPTRFATTLKDSPSVRPSRKTIVKFHNYLKMFEIDKVQEKSYMEYLRSFHTGGE